MAKVYKATIEYTIYPDENGLIESDFDIFDEDEIADNHRTPDELIKFVKEEFYDMLMSNFQTEHTYNSIWNSINVEVIND